MKAPLIHPLTLALLASPLVAQDVPLQLWTNASFPNGLVFGDCYGVSVGDYNSDGWVDCYVNYSGRLWLNVNGETWEEQPILLQPGGFRYGSAFADYDLDGRTDIATAPYGTTVPRRTHIFRGEPGGGFFDITTDPNLIDIIPRGPGETLIWMDVDFDADLDLLVPVYPTGHGNYFLENLGPTGPGGAYRFRERSSAAGLSNPLGTPRPEGADVWDVDLDGMVDIFCNATFYMNESTLGVPRFDPVLGNHSGYVFGGVNQIDEGAVLVDYDMDGDADLIALVCSYGTCIHENRGDGTFVLLPDSVIDSSSASCLGMSSADWDNDGDMDLTTANKFRRNMMVETGQRHFTLANHIIPFNHIRYATPAWLDWDLDGDLDTVMGNWNNVARFYENTLYDDTTAEDARRNLRVRVVRDAAHTREGVIAEFGATVELTIEDDTTGLRRLNTVSSGAGYLNQDEYVLHFALPSDPFPGNPDKDLTVALKVDFPTDPALGIRRIDGHVNPALARIQVADLVDREITVYRSGRVAIDGCVLAPYRSADPIMSTTGGRLAHATSSAALPDPVDVTDPTWNVGIEFDTQTATGSTRINEVLLDGVLRSSSYQCPAGSPFRFVFWDVTDRRNPFVLENGRYDFTRRDRNHRNAYAVDVTVPAGRVVRALASMESTRLSPFTGPETVEGVTTRGGLGFANLDPCGGAGVARAPVDSATLPFALRYTSTPGSPWIDVGRPVTGAAPPAWLRGNGDVRAGGTLNVSLYRAAPSTLTMLSIGTAAICDSAMPRILLARPDRRIPVQTGADGTWTWQTNLPAGVLTGTTIYLQATWPDSTAPGGLAASNTLSATVE